MTKAELRSQLMTDTLGFVLTGNAIQIVPSKAIRIKSTCRGKESRGKPIGGSIPTFRISSTFAGV